MTRILNKILADGLELATASRESKMSLIFLVYTRDLETSLKIGSDFSLINLCMCKLENDAFQKIQGED